MVGLYEMENAIQDYHWGSTDALARLSGRQPQGGHEAELWMGDHPKASSRVVLDGHPRALNELISDDPEVWLGELTAQDLPNRGLPYLFKILAAAEPLSIQVHPSREAATRGFDREERAGVPIAAPHRNYRDRNHKPELICALEEFWALQGFRGHNELAVEMAALIPELAARTELTEVVEALQRYAEKPDNVTWRDAFATLLRQTQLDPARTALTESVLKYARSRADGDLNSRYDWVVRMERYFPGDPGVAAPLYLNLRHLQAGEALFLPPRMLHAYLAGVGVEIMASSDNVLRAGCTRKHIDVEELLATALFEPYRSAPDSGRREGRITRYVTPAPEFELCRVDPPMQLRIAQSAAILLALGSGVTVADEETTHKLAPGSSLFVQPGTVHLWLNGAGPVYIAALPAAVQPAERSGDR